MSDTDKLSSDELMAAAWAVEHLEQKHGYASIVSHSGARVELAGLLDRLTECAALEASRTPPKPYRGKLFESKPGPECVEFAAPVTPAEGEAEEIARLVDPVNWRDSRAGIPFPDDDVMQAEFERNYESATWGFRKPSLEAARRILAAGFSRRSPVETEENWEYGIRSKGGRMINVALTEADYLRDGHRVADSPDFIFVKRIPEVPAGPWLPVTEEKK